MKTIFTMSCVIAALFCMALPKQSMAQSARNTLFVEGLGNGGAYSLNYDRLLSPNVALRVGFNFVPAIPVTLSYLVNLGAANHIELGIGFLATLGERSGFLGTGILGYRYQEPNGGLFFKAGFTPFFGNGFAPWVGVGAGFTF
jgi:hypothetical protein